MTTPPRPGRTKFTILILGGLLATSLVVANRFQRASAQDAAPRVMQITTSSPDALQLYYEARRFQEMAQTESARPLLQRALELDPDFMMAMDALRGASPTFLESRQVLTRMQAALPEATLSEGEQMHFAALQAAFDGNRDGRLEILEAMVKRFPDDIRIRYQFALSSFGTDDEKTATRLGELTERAPDFVPAYNILGYSLKNLGRMEEAEAAFRTAIDLNPDNPNAHDSYGELLLAMGRHEDSIASYDQTLAREPLFPSAQIGVASNLLLMGRQEEARARLDDLYAIAPHDGMRSGIHWAKAVTYVDQGRTQEALAELERNLGLSRKGGDLSAMALDKSNLALCHLEAGHLDRAEMLATEALEHRIEVADGDERQEAFARFNHAYLSARIAVANGDLSAAESIIQEADRIAIALDAPNLGQTVHEIRGILALAEGEYQAAIDELEQANATEAYNMFRIAEAYEALGESDRARDFYGWVRSYNSPLNLNFSFVRHRAGERLSALEGGS